MHPPDPIVADDPLLKRFFAANNPILLLTVATMILMGGPLLLPGVVSPADWQPYWIGGLCVAGGLTWRQLHRIGQSHRFPQHPLSFSILLLLTWLPVNLWAAGFGLQAWIQAGYLLFGVAVFWLLVTLPVTRRSPLIVAYLLLPLAASILIGAPFLTQWKSEFRLFHLPLYHTLRAIQVAGPGVLHANVLAGTLALLLPLGVAVVLDMAFARGHRAIWLVTLLLTVAALGLLLLSQSRGGYLAAGTGIVAVLIARRPRLLYLTPFVLAAALLSLTVFDLSRVLDELSRDGSLGGWDGRWTIWQAAIQTLVDMPLTGIGIGSFTAVIPLLHSLPFSIDSFPHAHNLVLQIGLDHGIVGLIAYCAMQLILFFLLVALIRAPGPNAKVAPGPAVQERDLERTVAIGCGGALVALNVHGLLDAVTWGVKPAFVPWMIYALVVLLYLQHVAIPFTETS